MAKRPLNRCKSCRDTWHPRGRDLSNRCPSCGSTDVERAGSGWLALVVVAALGVFGLLVTGVITPDRLPTEDTAADRDRLTQSGGSRPAPPRTADQGEAAPGPLLKLTHSLGSRLNDFNYEVIGDLRNTGLEMAAGVVVTVRFIFAGGRTEERKVELGAIAPGETKTFRVGYTENDAGGVRHFEVTWKP